MLPRTQRPEGHSDYADRRSDTAQPQRQSVGLADWASPLSLPIVGVFLRRCRHRWSDSHQFAGQDPRGLAWAKRGASSPSLISRVTAKRLNTVGGKNKRELSSKPSVLVSMSPTAL